MQTSEVFENFGSLLQPEPMPRRYIPFVSNTYYHIYNRGNNRQPVFFEPANYLYFLHGLKRYVRPAADVIAYCLMPTHYHMLVRVLPQQTSDAPTKRRTSEVSLSRAMQKLSISYTKAINKRFSRVGALFQGAFEARPIRSFGYLLNLCIYIHANPVKDGLTHLPEEWQYSNYLEWLGERRGALVDAAFIRDHFETAAEYKSLMTEYIKTRMLPEDVLSYLQEVEK